MTNEEAQLTMPSAQEIVRVLKKLGEIGEISQKEMADQAVDSIVKKKPGKYQLAYKKKTRTIVAEPRIWEWEPEVGEAVHIDGMIAYVTSVKLPDTQFNLPSTLTLRNRFDKDFTGHKENGVWLSRDGLYIIPILDWQKIEKITREFGFILGQNDFTDRDGVITYGAWFNRMGHWSKFGEGRNRQTAVTLALLELEKELK